MTPPTVAHAEILNPRLQSDKDTLAREFQEAEPFRHVVIPDFFAPDGRPAAASTIFPTSRSATRAGETGEVGRKAARRDVRDISDAYREVDDFFQTPEFLNLMSDITGIPDLLYDSEYHGGGTHENLDGASLYTHVDFNYHPKGWHRRLNLIVYLSPEWEEEWGGSLELTRIRGSPGRPRQARADEVQPRGDLRDERASWHGFPRIRLPEDRRHLTRKSFAIYLYTKDRPADQTAASHSTIYVPSGCPRSCSPGLS